VAKKPPQSQRGGSHGLTQWTSAGLRPKKENIKKINFKNCFFFFFFFFGFPPSGVAPRMSAGLSKIIQTYVKSTINTVFPSFLFVGVFLQEKIGISST
jgi:hypothetical protein